MTPVTPELKGISYPCCRDRVRRGRVPSAFAASEFELHPLFVVPGLVRGLPADGCGDDVERAVPHNKPLILVFQQQNEAAAHRPLVAVGCAVRAPRRNAGSGPRKIGEAESCLEQGNAALVIGDARWKFTLRTFIEVSCQDDSAEREAQLVDEEQQGDTNRSPLGATVVDMDVGNRETGARGSSAEFASDNLALEGPQRVPVSAGPWIGVHV